jgi:predicted 3-demethylubiquinone-9 3-methyltransferase (glyoxalase superfamily)
MSSKQRITPSAKIVPHLWFVDKAVEAANFYVSLFPDSRVDSVTPLLQMKKLDIARLEQAYATP